MISDTLGKAANSLKIFPRVIIGGTISEVISKVIDTMKIIRMRHIAEQ